MRWTLTDVDMAEAVAMWIKARAPAPDHLTCDICVSLGVDKHGAMSARVWTHDDPPLDAPPNWTDGRRFG